MAPLIKTLHLFVNIIEKYTVTAPLMDAASNEKLWFWGLDYHIKNAFLLVNLGGRPLIENVATVFVVFTKSSFLVYITV